MYSLYCCIVIVKSSLLVLVLVVAAAMYLLLLICVYIYIDLTTQQLPMLYSHYSSYWHYVLRQ